jgi:NTP pyrophosphatase (non-canonical NTP hydrolase)
MQKSYEGVVEFQTLCGKLDHVANRHSLLNQAKLILEEAKELVEAIESEGEEQILKETCDNLVVVFGMVAMLQRSGYSVSEAMQKVNWNNMSKFCTKQTDAYYTLSAYQATALQPFELKQVDYDKWGIFNADGKLQKPLGYEKCSLKSFIPQGGGDND